MYHLGYGKITGCESVNGFRGCSVESSSGCWQGEHLVGEVNIAHEVVVRAGVRFKRLKDKRYDDEFRKTVQ